MTHACFAISRSSTLEFSRQKACRCTSTDYCSSIVAGHKSHHRINAVQEVDITVTLATRMREATVLLLSASIMSHHLGSAAGMDFESFGSDLEAAKAATLQHTQQSSSPSELQSRVIESASSVGLLLNGMIYGQNPAIADLQPSLLHRSHRCIAVSHPGFLGLLLDCFIYDRTPAIADLPRNLPCCIGCHRCTNVSHTGSLGFAAQWGAMLRIKVHSQRMDSLPVHLGLPLKPLMHQGTMSSQDSSCALHSNHNQLSSIKGWNGGFDCCYNCRTDKV